MDGLEMLAQQAARSFFLWTRKRVPARDFLLGAKKQLQFYG
jgi:shikimate 5-dehydrogenase